MTVRTDTTPLVIHEWVEKLGGSEKVVAQIREALGASDVEALWADHPEAVGVRDGAISESVLARTPLRRSKALALPAMPLVWRMRAERRRRSVVVVSSHLFAHHAKVPAGVPKLVYVHTPARYIWSPELDPRGRSIAARAVSALLKPLDRKRAAEATSIVANSRFVRDRIVQAWGRDAEVIYPPVAVRLVQSRPDWSDALEPDEAATLASLPPHFILGVSRFIEYKRLGRVIDIGADAGIPVVLAGSGPLRTQLEEQGTARGADLTILESPSDALLYALYQRARVLIFPAVEDFGIVPVEAMATGTPVIAHHIGGAGESVEHGVSGYLVDIDDDAQVRDALMSVHLLDREAIAQRAMRFDTQDFQRAVRAWVARYSKGGQQCSG